MASNVNEAFKEFMSSCINLDPAVTRRAKSSRDWLMDRIHDFPGNDATFPTLYEEMDVFFGSFERKTKRRPLDDIDIMVCLNADGTSYYHGLYETIYLRNPNVGSPLRNLLFEDGVTVNSRRVVNKFKDALSSVPQYDRADIKRKGEAATLSLKSYDWVFDIVPCIRTQTDSAGKAYYLIPDGEGNWKKTDPTIDRARVRRLTAERGVGILGVIRLVKFWNCRPTMPTMGSYLLENMILDYYEHNACGAFIDLEFIKVIKQVEYAIFRPVYDPKGIQGDLNTVNWADRLRISVRCGSDHTKCVEARNLEVASEDRRAIAKWGEIFGDTFPTYS